MASAGRVLSALEQVQPFAPTEQIPALEAALVERASEMSERDLGRLCRSLPDLFDPDGAERREELLRSRSGVFVSQLPIGLTRVVILAHPEAAGFLLTALDARIALKRQPTFELVDEHGADEPDLDDSRADDAFRDDRPLAQRRLDALVSIARESIEHDPGQVGGTAVTMVVTIGLDDLLKRVGTASIEGVDEPISAATARRLAAQAEIIPMILGGPSEPLDVGVKQRCGTSSQRRALAIRDQGCLWMGCHAPPGWCEVAHVVAWQLGGQTDLRNLALFCPFHHRRFDNDGWKLEWQGEQRYLIPPSHVDARRTPRRVGPVQLAA